MVKARDQPFLGGLVRGWRQFAHPEHAEWRRLYAPLIRHCAEGGIPRGREQPLVVAMEQRLRADAQPLAQVVVTAERGDDVPKFASGVFHSESIMLKLSALCNRKFPPYRFRYKMDEYPHHEGAP